MVSNVQILRASPPGPAPTEVAVKSRFLLYRNRVDSSNHWIGFKLVGTRSNRSAIGAEVTIESGDLVQRRVVDGGSGFASQNDRRPHFGLGKREWVDRVVVEWPSGARQVLARPPIDQFVTVTEPAR